MAKIDRLAKLFQALAHGDNAGAEKVAAEICADEEQRGHHSAARLLRGALRKNGNGAMRPGEAFGMTTDTPPVQPLLSSAALTALPHTIALSDVVLKRRWRDELADFVREWQQRSVLDQRGIRRRTKLFFYGPPGCGKSLTARALAKEMGLPLYVVRFDAVIGAYLGQTAIHLRQLFHFAETVPCVLLFDELDALGKKRGNPLDVGELDRIVIALMQELEHSHSSGAIIATSNLPRHVDDALWRRFDLAAEFPPPTKAELLAFAKRIAAAHHISLGRKLPQRVATAKSFAGAEKLLEAEARRLALSEG
jgi:hypothetical protein